MFSDKDPFTARMLVNGGAAVIGRSGCGKTSSVGKRLQRALAYLRGLGMLVLCAMPSDLPMVEESLTRAGRRGQLRVFGPGYGSQFNITDYLLKSGATVKDIALFICTVGETIRNTTGGGEHEGVWLPQEIMGTEHSVCIVKHATGRVDPSHLERFINDAAQSPEQLKNEQWKNGFHCQLINWAVHAPKSAFDEHEVKRAVEYWLMRIPFLAPETRSSIFIGITSVLHTFNSGIVRQLLGSGTNCSPAELFDGNWWCVNMPPSEYGDAGIFVNGAIKLIVQKMILKRQNPTNIVGIWGDEAPNWITSFDSPYLAQCRQKLGFQAYLAQSLSSFYEKLGGTDKGKHQANAMLANFGLKVVMALGDPDSADWAMKLVGKGKHIDVDTSGPAQEEPYDVYMGRSKVHMHAKESVRPFLEAREFMTGLRTGGPENDFFCDSIVIRSGEPFSNGRNWLRVAWSQKD